MVDQTSGGTRGRKPPFWAVERPARLYTEPPYKIELLRETLRPLNRPGPIKKLFYPNPVDHGKREARLLNRPGRER
jgi:hypothetical protein